MRHKWLLPVILSCLMVSSCSTMMDINPPAVDEDVVVNLETPDLYLDVGQSHTLNAFVEGVEQVTWINSNPSVISLTKSSLSATLVGLSAGTSVVTAIAQTKSARCTVTVGGGGGGAVVSTISLNLNNKTIDIEETFDLVATIVGSNKANISWTSTDSAVATVVKKDNTSAMVTGVSGGNAKITATAGGKSASCDVVVNNAEATLSVRLDKSSASIQEGSTLKLNATTYPSNTTVTWQSNKQGVATVNHDGLVTAVAPGSATISASVTNGVESKTAECVITVTSGSSSDYEQQIAAWSQPGHLYLHYLRNTDSDYSKWALWIWQNYPLDSEGSLWGANSEYSLAVSAYTLGSMTNAQCNNGTGNDAYVDQYGIVIDVNLTDLAVVGGKTGANAPLVLDEQWDSDIYAKLKLGFLIVDQSKMTGEDMWTSDGGAETYMRLGKLLPQGKSAFIHVYCVEGAVSDFTTSSGTQEVSNPTLTDQTGMYRSQNDITNLKYDAFSSGVATSTSFLQDEPGIGYQIFVPSFADSDGDGYGDIQGIISKLQYLDDLGVNVLWLTPIQESNSYHGYDVTDYYKIDERFGTLADYQELLYKAHERGMKVLMDMVINHTSKSNVLFKKSQRAETEVINGKTINYRDMYLWKFEGDEILEWDGVEAPKDTPYGPNNPATFIRKEVQQSDDWYRDGTSKYYYYGKFGSGMAELNYSSQATRDYMTDMCKYWLSFGLDGFRLDAIKHIYLVGELNPDDFFANYKINDYITYDVSYRTYYNEETRSNKTVQNDYTYDRDLNVMFWKQFAGTLKSAYPNCFLVGENFDGWNERMAPFYEAMDSQFDFSTYYHLNEKPFAGMPYDMQNTASIYSGFRSQLINGSYTSNHDIARLLNHAAGYPGDYTGNGVHHVEISNSNKAFANNNARVYAALTLLNPGLSWIYYGDELGMSGNTADQVADSSGHVVDDHGNNVDRWYRQPMRWGATKGQDSVVNYRFSGLEVLWDNYNQSLATVTEQNADQTSMLKLFQALGEAKNSSDFPTYGRIVNHWDEVAGSMTCMQISDGSRTVNVFINYSGNVQSISGLNQGALIACSNGGSATTVGAYGFTVVKK